MMMHSDIMWIKNDNMLSLVSALFYDQHFQFIFSAGWEVEKETGEVKHVCGYKTSRYPPPTHPTTPHPRHILLGRDIVCVCVCAHAHVRAFYWHCVCTRSCVRVCVCGCVCGCTQVCTQSCVCVFFMLCVKVFVNFVCFIYLFICHWFVYGYLCIVCFSLVCKMLRVSESAL